MPSESSERHQARHDLLETAIRREGSFTLAAEGTSMLPTIRSGEALTVRPPDALRFGDVLQCRSGERSVVHRLVRRIRRDGGMLYVTKGDNRLEFDEPVPAGDVLGVVVSVEGRRARNAVLGVLSLVQGGAPGTLGEVLLEFNRVTGAVLRRLTPKVDS